ncbi:alpha/beta hydrolase [Pseudomonas sp. COR58]|uniref:Alpha/beta hydrolase n=1 Tax=Pseudomonas ekonensis TaxID=2842353 RepID=A0ABS6PET6_9PSED|nr:alpha/beta hydrolase [Pseudomonas ekonensis]MBV4458537.1 alpha/beta hydrolase [Pseudomonas ekonensis]
MQSTYTRQYRIDTPRGRLFAQSWSPSEERAAPIVLLHDSLGCVALWRTFPERLAQASGRQVIAYDRLGFGCSDAVAGKLPLSFIDDEAHGSFRALYRELKLNQFVLMGHSVGGGMAVGCAAAYKEACLGLITESAQAFVEPATLTGIRAAERQFASAEQLEKLRRYHGEKAEWVLRTWIDTWSADAFSQWNLDKQLSKVHCPLLALHGDQDEYGSQQHPERICAQASGPASLQVFANCGHVPHREHPDAVMAAITVFLASSDKAVPA